MRLDKFYFMFFSHFLYFQFPFVSFEMFLERLRNTSDALLADTTHQNGNLILGCWSKNPPQGVKCSI